MHAGLSPPCRSTITRILLWMLVLAHSAIGTVGAASLSHVPLGDAAHVHVSGGHGDSHSHDAEEPDRAGTHPAHDATDHSHDKPNVPPLHLTRALTCVEPLNAREARRDYPSPCSLPERPPRPIPTT